MNKRKYDTGTGNASTIRDAQGGEEIDGGKLNGGKKTLWGGNKCGGREPK